MKTYHLHDNGIACLVTLNFLHFGKKLNYVQTFFVSQWITSS